MASASEVELSGMGCVRSMRKQESHEFIRGSVKSSNSQRAQISRSVSFM